MPFYTHDNTIDSPINNFAILNPLAKGSYVSTSNGNLTLSGNTSANSANCLATIGELKSGLWYWEFRQGTTASETCGIALTFTSGSTQINGEAIGNYGIGQRYTGALFTGAGAINTSNTWGSGDIIRICVDVDAGAIYIGKNAGWFNSADPTSGSSKTGAVSTWDTSTASVTPVFGAYNSGSVTVNFGQDQSFGGQKQNGGGYTDANGIGQFHHQPPDGALSLCTANLPEGPIKLSEDHTPSDHFKAVTWTGQTNSSTYNNGDVTVGFQPDFVWIKNRDSSAHGNLFDSLRGVQKAIYSGTSQQESTDSTTLTAFNSNGVNVGSNMGVNEDGSKMVAWVWKAAGSPASGQAKIINEDGSAMNPTSAEAVRNSGSIVPDKISANRQNGFSIVKYQGDNTTGSTVAHGLSTAPDMVILKNLDVNLSSSWQVSLNSKVTGSKGYLRLHLTDQMYTTYPQYDTGIDANLLTFNGATGSAGEGAYNNLVNNYIAYCWHSVEGYSKFGHAHNETGPDGCFVYCGFKPSLVLWRNLNNSRGWMVHDSARNPQNPLVDSLDWASSAAESNFGYGEVMDFVSNGFKLRNNNSPNFREAGGGFLFAAFGQSPFSAPATAR